MRIGLLVLRMNALAHFLPLAKFLKEKNYNVTFVISPTKDNKQNSVNSSENYFKFLQCIESNGINSVYPCSNYEDLLSLNLDFLFSVEGAGFPSDKKSNKYKHIILQNYHDQSFSMQYHTTENIYKNNYSMWFNELFHTQLATYDLHYENKTITSVLPYYWDYENKNKIEIINKFNLVCASKIAICFLPRNVEIITESWKDVKYTPCDTIRTGTPEKYLEHALKFAEFLSENGYSIIFKQRAKNRNTELEHLKNYIEDISYYPSTSLDLTFVADLCYGYTSSSIMNAATLGTPYINFYKTQFSPITEKIFDHYYDIYPSIQKQHMSSKFEDISIPEKQKNNLTEKIKFSKENITRSLDD